MLDPTRRCGLCTHRVLFFGTVSLDGLPPHREVYWHRRCFRYFTDAMNALHALRGTR